MSLFRRFIGAECRLVLALLLSSPATVRAATIYHYAGIVGLSGYSGDGGPATNATLQSPRALAIDSAGNVFISDQNSVIRRVDGASGIITTFAGNGGFDYSGDGGPATNASFIIPEGLATDTNGNVYIADSYDNRIRKVDVQTGIITTVAGGAQFPFRGDGGPATAAWLWLPTGVAVDAVGNIYIADLGDRRVRKVDAATHRISTIAGWDAPSDSGGHATSGGDGGPATQASFAYLWRLSVDESGNVFVIDRVYDDETHETPLARVRRIDAATGVITRFAGGGTNRTWTGAAAEADLGDVRDIAVARNRLLILGELRGWEVDLTTGTIRLFAGTGAVGDSGDGGPATAATFGGANSGASPEGLLGIAIAPNDDVFVADAANANRVRRIEAHVRLQASPSNVAVMVGGSVTIIPSGGTQPYTFSLATNNSGASINPTNGLYTAGSTGDVIDTVRITDALGDSVIVTANVTPRVRHFSIRSVVAGGGGVATGNGRSVKDTIGQAGTGGPLTNGQFSLVGGFWALPIAVQNAEAPRLTIVPADPGFATISWSPPTPGFHLQVSESLSSPAWSGAPSGATNPVTVPATLPVKFYRLIKPRQISIQ